MKTKQQLGQKKTRQNTHQQTPIICINQTIINFNINININTLWLYLFAREWFRNYEVEPFIGLLV